MADNDIYNSKKNYEDFLRELDNFDIPPDQRQRTRANKKRKYYCRNRSNLDYFRRLAAMFEAKDLSYIRRHRLFQTFKLICNSTERDLKDCDREEIDRIVAQMHLVYLSPKSKSDFLRDMKYMWKFLFPEKDAQGRLDDGIVPYQVRHLSCKIDKSKEKRRNDKLNPAEFEQIVDYFSKDARLQFYLMLAFESLGRPQEILYTKLKDLEISDNYAKLWISSHGKEGVGFLQIIDSYPYLLKWLNQHPTPKNKDAYLFLNIGGRGFAKQLTPNNITLQLKLACKNLGIEKNITAYSIKRNGVTFRRLRGDSDVEIQHTARWSSLKQLKTYDQSSQEDTFRLSLVKKGLLKDDKISEFEPKIKTCTFCNARNGFNEQFCSGCKRPLDRKQITEEYNRLTSMQQLVEKHSKEIELISSFFSEIPVRKMFEDFLLQKKKEQAKG